jgi:hypothetical protein
MQSRRGSLATYRDLLACRARQRGGLQHAHAPSELMRNPLSSPTSPIATAATPPKARDLKRWMVGAGLQKIDVIPHDEQDALVLLRLGGYGHARRHRGSEQQTKTGTSGDTHSLFPRLGCQMGWQLAPGDVATAARPIAVFRSTTLVSLVEGRNRPWSLIRITGDCFDADHFQKQVAVIKIITFSWRVSRVLIVRSTRLSYRALRAIIKPNIFSIEREREGLLSLGRHNRKCCDPSGARRRNAGLECTPCLRRQMAALQLLPRCLRRF